MKIVHPELNAEEIFTLRTAPHTLAGYSNIGPGSPGHAVWNLKRFGYLAATEMKMDRDPGATVTTFDLTSEGRKLLKRLPPD